MINAMPAVYTGIQWRNIMDFAKMIDHTILKPDATKEDVKKLCDEAAAYGFHSVCVNSSFVYYCAQLLKETDVKVCTVVGFPLGAMSTDGKVGETLTAVYDGAEEIDMVIHVGMIKSGNWQYVKDDIAAVVEAAAGRAIVKVIMETCLLTDEEKIKACQICKEAGADFVKTSTGFSKGGATAAAISHQMDIEDKLYKIKCPLLVQHTEKDPIIGTEGAKALYHKSSSEVKEYWEHEGSMHCANDIELKACAYAVDWILDQLK